MADNLTQQILSDLEKQRNAISSPTPPKAQPSPQQSGITLYEALQKGIAEQSADPSDKKSGIVHGVGSGLWHFADSALMGIPSLIAKDMTGEKPYDLMGGKTEGLATVGGVVGEAAGFLVPIGWVGKGMRAVVSTASKAGTRAVVRQSAKVGAKTAGKVGLSKNVAERAIKSGLRAPEITGTGKALSKYELSLEKLKEGENAVRASIFTNLKKQFADATDDQLLQITEASTRAMKSEGVHINNLSTLIERGLNRSLSIQDKSAITKYAARAAEMTTSFGIYNLLHDGIHTIAGEKEFDPVTDVKDALIFSLFLPAVEMVGKGGQVHIRKQAWDLWKGLRKVRLDKIDDLTDSQANGILEILTKDSFLSESKGAISGIGKIAQRYASAKPDRELAIEAIKKIYEKINPETMWKTFYKEAKDDFVASTGRMLLGAAYFNLQTILDTNMLKNLPPEEIMTHLLVGAFFTKIKKPLFQKELPHLNGFAERARALEYLGLDAKNFEHWSTAFKDENKFAAAFSGILGNKQVNEIERIFELERNQQEKPDWEPPATALGDVGELSNRYRLVQYAHGLYELSHRSRNMHDINAAEGHVKLEHLTEGQLREIQSKLENIDISETQKLTKDEFHDWKNDVLKESLSNNAIMHLESLMKMAEEIGLNFDRPDKIDIDKPIRMARLVGTKEQFANPEYHTLNYFNSLRNVLRDIGLVEDIPQRVGEKELSIREIKNDGATRHKVENELNLLERTLVQDNYGGNYPDKIKITDINDNAFLVAIAEYKIGKKQDRLFNIVENRYSKFEKSDSNLHDIMETHFGSQVPKELFRKGELLTIGRGEMTEKEWEQTELERQKVQTQITFIAKTWGLGRGNGPIEAEKKGRPLDYETAKKIVDTFEAEGFNFTKQTLEIQTRRHYERLFNSPHISTNHLTLLEGSINHGFAEVTREEGRPKLKVLDRETVQAALYEQYKGDKSQIDPLMEKYDAILKHMGQLTGEYVEYVREASFVKLADVDVAIESVYNLTESYNRNMLKTYNEIKTKSEADRIRLTEVDAIFDELYEPLPEGVVDFSQRKRKPVDSEDKWNSVRDKIDKVLKNPPELISKDFLQTLSELRQNIETEFGSNKMTQGVNSVSKMLYQTMLTHVNEVDRVNTVLDEIMNDLQNYSNDRIAANDRKDRLMARFREMMEGTKFRIETNEAKTLSEMVSVFGKNNKLGEAIFQMEQSLRVWRNSYNETEFFEMERKIAEQMNDYSTNYSEKQQEVSPSVLSNRYEKFNENLRSREFSKILESLNESYQMYESEPTTQHRKWLEESKFEIRNEIISAIENKWDIEGGKIELSEKQIEASKQSEIDMFLQHTYPMLLSMQLGRTTIPSAKLMVGRGGKPILEIGKTLIGKGMTAEFIAEMKDIGIDVMMMDRQGTVNGRKVDINDIENIQKTVKNSRIVDEIQSQLLYTLDKGTVEEPGRLTDIFSNPVRIVVSQNTSLMVGASQLKDGSLNRKFKEWYDTKSEFFREQNMDVELRNLENIYGHLVKESELNTQATEHDAEWMIRAMYHDKVSSVKFNELVGAAMDSGQLGRLSGGFFKYVALTEASGAKSQASWNLLRELRKDAKKQPGILNTEQIAAINFYEQTGGFKIVGVADEMKGLDGSIRSPMSVKALVENELREMVENKELAEENLKYVQERLDSLDSSSINAISYLGENAAHLLYLHKGRRLFEGNQFGTAGVKPTGWYNTATESILLKTNFVYDPLIAEVMNRAGIDILTTESAAKSFNAELVEINKAQFDALPEKSTVEVARLAVENAGAINKAIMKLENLFLGKVEDRKALTSVTYSMTDFMSEAGFKSFTKDYIDYNEALNYQQEKLYNIVSGVHRFGTAQFLMNKLKENNEMFEESTDGLASAYLDVGVDPNSVLIHDTIKRLAFKNLLSELRKPKTKGASYSILVPYIEGSIPLYRDINNNGKRRQVTFGGKKLSHSDGNVAIKDFRKLQYVVSSDMPVAGKMIKRDILLGKDENGNWTVTDPYNRIKTSDLKSEIELIETTEREMSVRSPKIRELHERLMDFNSSERANQLRSSVHLHSLSLRMPNLGGDVGNHKVEGFYSKEQGNIVGVNAFDIAQIHQADFDVDAMFSYNVKPHEVSNELFKFAGHSIEAYKYTSDAPSLDYFGNNQESSRAGSAYPAGDPFHNHNKLFMQSKRNFGVVKKLSTSLSAILRQADLIQMEGVDFIGKDKSKTNEEQRGELSTFLQTYKNVEQSIIDAAKKPNWASASRSEDIVRYLLFGDKPDGNFKYNLTAEQEIKFGQKDFNGFFNLEKIKNHAHREIHKQAIIEFIRAMNGPQRLLTDVFDESGRRPPDANEIARIRQDYYEFTESPNKYVYDRIRFRLSNYKPEGWRTKLKHLNEVYFGSDFDSFTDYKNYMGDAKFLIPKNDIFYIDPSRISTFRESTIAGKVAVNLSQSKSNLEGYRKSLSNVGQIAANESQRVLENLEIALSLSGKDNHADIMSQLEGNQVFSGSYIKNFYGDLKKGQLVDEKKIENYSLLFHAFTSEKKSLEKYIRKAGHRKNESHRMAERKLFHIENVMEHLKNLEAQMVENVFSRKDDIEFKRLSKRFNIQRKEIRTNKKGGQRVKNESKSDWMYVYKRTSEDGRIRLNKVTAIRPGYSETLYNGEYYLMKNPIKYESMQTSDVLDGYAMMKATADIQLSHLGFQNHMHEKSFIEEFTNLKRNLGALASDTFKFNKKNPNASENWQLERSMEDAMVRVFMDRWTSPERRMSESEAGDRSPNQYFDLVRYMMKPDPVFNTRVHANGVRLPKYKINKRVVNAVGRWMIENGLREEFHAIFGTYGAEYRRMNDGILPTETVDLFKSKLYDAKEREINIGEDPYYDISFEKSELYGFNPVVSMKHHHRHTLARTANRNKAKSDENGNLQFIYSFGEYRKIQNDLEFYENPKDLGKQNLTDCG